ncbi:GGDEF domain-containing protein [Trichloromonas sp.]|uniref:GGDEF domain-containing protein n=1 Tax=Trichloromonas sp. TaxID=3069249 RepID=UPI003D818083
MRITFLLKILAVLFVLALLGGLRSLYHLLFIRQSLADLGRSQGPSLDPGLIAAAPLHVELAFYSFCVMSVTFALLLLLSWRTLSSLRRLYRLIDHRIGHRFLDLPGNPAVTNEFKEFERDLDVVAQKLEDYGQLCLDASPLTRLPGNIAIERVLMEKMRCGEKFALCYVDLDNFKFYNDRYGFAAGSDVLKLTGDIVRGAQRSAGNQDDFVGHIGGDDFVVITSPERASAVCERIILDFDRAIVDHYRPEDRVDGALVGVDRYGVERSFSVMTLSIAVVSDAYRDIKSPTEIAKIAAEIKEYVKRQPGSNYLIDRRRRLYSEQ